MVEIPEPVSLDALANVPCVVALGDPGLGKSHAVQDYAAAVAASVPPDRLVAVDLSEYASRDELRQNVFRVPSVEAWSGPGEPVHLVLDSLDESPIDFQTVCGIVIDELDRILDRIPRERMRFRIACRTAVMPPDFVHSLKVLFARARETRSPALRISEAPEASELVGLENPEGAEEQAPEDLQRELLHREIDAPAAPQADSSDAEQCVVVEIGVLRRDDALAAAAAVLGGDGPAAAFLSAVIAANAGAFAARPITLRALLYRHRAGRPLGGSQADLYRDLCRELSEPVSARPGAVPRQRALQTTLDERYRVAGRLAAAMLFGNLRGVWCGDGPPPSSQLLDPHDCDGIERMGADVHRVDAAMSTSEALNTALFTGRTGDAAVDDSGGALASHQTFAEFLAADWVCAHEMKLPQILSLLHDPTDPERRVVPQLRQVAAWLSSMRADILAAVAAREPELLLSSDVVHIPDASRQALVASLLVRSEANRLMRPSFGERLSYDRLNHPSLGAQLGPVLQDAARPVRVRLLALEIARACRVKALAAIGAEIALDTREPLDVRTAAAMLVASAGAVPERCLLMMLVDAPPAEDEAEELRGAALLASWRLLTPDQLFAVLTRPRRPNWSGAYFLALREIAAGLGSEYIIEAARWLARLGPGSSAGAFDGLVEGALCLAIEHAEDDCVRAPLLTYIRRRLRRHMGLGDSLTGRTPTRVQRTLQNVGEARRRLVRALFDSEPGWPPPGPHGDEATDGAGVEGVVGPDGALVGRAPTDLAELLRLDYSANVRWISREVPELFSESDVPWALGILAGLPAGDPRRAVWRDAIRFAFQPAEASHLEVALRYRDDVDVGHATLDWSSYPTLEAAKEALVSAQRTHAAAEAARIEARQARTAEGERQRPAPIGERVTPLLVSPAASAAAIPAAATPVTAGASTPATQGTLWARIYFELVRDPESGRVRGAAPSAETLDALRASLSADQLLQVVNAALSYLNREPAEADPYPPNGTLPWRTLHGGAAALFVACMAPARLAEVTEAGWRRWLPTLVRFTTYSDETERPLLEVVFERAVRAAHDALHSALLDAADASLRDSGRRVNSVAQRLAITTLPVAQELVRRAASYAYPPRETERLLSEMLRESGAVGDAARATATHLLAATPAASQVRGARTASNGTTNAGRGARDCTGGAREIPVGAGPERDAAIAAAAALIAGDADAGWDIIGTRLGEDRAFARDVLLFGAQNERLRDPGAASRLSADRLADLYQIAQREFPHETDPWYVGAYSPGPNDLIRDWRDGLLSVLESRATDEAVEALARIAAASPARDWLVQTWLRASAARISARWAGTPPRTLMAMAEQPHLRQVRSSEQLLDILEESLDRLQRDLQGELRSVVGLWDEQRPRPRRAAAGRMSRGAAKRATSTWRPKDEGHLANEIARHLRRDLGERGVIVGRELVVQVGISGGAPGLRTDLDIRARPAGASAATVPDIRVIIEVKGSWNREVLTAMRTQLVEDYLNSLDVRHGIYLVGAYTCDAWEESEEKRRSARLGSRAELQCRLSEQALELSSPLRQVRAVVLQMSLPAEYPRSTRSA